ncbi:helix-turn-helix domain-containing protein [Aerococcaceae bacterium zg-B36]|nr:helix-turn-helix domain-containing protein [Aerococcaceae bacterium zg-B36]
MKGVIAMFSKNLKYLREKNAMEQMELANLLGKKSSSSISEWESGKYTPKIGVLSEIANIFHVELDDLMNRDLSFKPTNILTIKPTKIIPVIGEIACGSPILADENIIDTVAFPVELLPSGDIFFLKASGDSMEPVINDGAYVMIRKQETIENGEIGAVLLNDDTEATLKKIRKMGNSILLEAINSDYEPILINEDYPARIIGKAVKVLNDL